MTTIHSLARRHPRETVLCLHSSGATGRQWDAYAAFIEPQVRLLQPDLLGYGGAQRWNPGAPTTLAAEAEYLAPLLGGGVHLVGHSYGAAVALQMALRWPQQVLSLTLYEPVRFALLSADPATEASANAIVGVGRRIGFETLSGRLHAAAERFVDYWSGPGSWQALGEPRRRQVAERMPKIQAEFEALFADRVPALAYRRLAMPITLACGTRSPLPARQVWECLAAQWPQAVRARIDGAGHMGPLTHVPQFAALLPRSVRRASLDAAA